MLRPLLVIRAARRRISDTLSLATVGRLPGALSDFGEGIDTRHALLHVAGMSHPAGRALSID